MSTSKDDNAEPVAYGVSHLDGVTPIRIRFQAGTRVMMVDASTTIAFNPAIKGTAQTNNDFPVIKGTSSADDSTVLAWVVNATTGAVLIST